MTGGLEHAFQVSRVVSTQTRPHPDMVASHLDLALTPDDQKPGTARSRAFFLCEASGSRGCRRGQASAALAQAGQARIRLAVTRLEVRLAATADVHLRTRHERADTGLGTGPGCRVLCLGLSKLQRSIRRGGGRGAACGHGAVNPKCKTQRWGRWRPRQPAIVPAFGNTRVNGCTDHPSSSI